MRIWGLWLFTKVVTYLTMSYPFRGVAYWSRISWHPHNAIFPHWGRTERQIRCRSLANITYIRKHRAAACSVQRMSCSGWGAACSGWAVADVDQAAQREIRCRSSANITYIRKHRAAACSGWAVADAQEISGINRFRYTHTMCDLPLIKLDKRERETSAWEQREGDRRSSEAHVVVFRLSVSPNLERHCRISTPNRQISTAPRERDRENFFSQGFHRVRIVFSDRFSHHLDQKNLLRREFLGALENTFFSLQERRPFH